MTFLLSSCIPPTRQVLDVATPATLIRYTHTWQGSYEGWYPSDNPLSPPSLSKTLPGLDQFYMVGHWVEPGGGLPIVAQSGRHLAQIMCKRDRKRFVAARRSGLPERLAVPTQRGEPQVAL